jgi:hypothetical protein
LESLRIRLPIATLGFHVSSSIASSQSTQEAHA